MAKRDAVTVGRRQCVGMEGGGWRDEKDIDHDSHLPEDSAAPPSWYVPRRGITAVMLFSGLSVVYALRVCISIAAVPGLPATNATSAAAARNATVTMYSGNLFLF